MGPLARGLAAGAAQLALAVVAVAVGLWLSGAAPTTSLALVVVVAALVVGLEAAAQRADDRQPAAATDRWLAGSTSLGVACALIGAPFELAWLGRVHPAGLVLALLGAALRASAISTLGGAFISAAQAPSELTTSGLYGWVRHPSELGLLLVGGGFALAAPGLASALGLVIVVVSSALRIRREDRALAYAFGALHRSYARRVSALVPGAR